MTRQDMPTLIVDLSNVCRDRDLGSQTRRALWEPYVRVIAAWREQVDPDARIIAVADANLRRLFSNADVRLFDNARRSGEAEVAAGAADEEILVLAEKAGASVLSRDRYVGHRRAHPWIQGCVDRFFVWRVGDDGTIRIAARDMRIASPYSVSRGAEADRLKDRGLDPSRRTEDERILAHAYRCENEGCLTSRYHPERLLVPPERKGDARVCPGCRQPLVDLGPRPGAVELVLEALDGAEAGRKVLEEEMAIELGRGDASPEAFTDPGTCRLVSRSHIRVRWVGSELQVEDLDSRNGTALQRWDSVQRTLTRPESIPVGGVVTLRTRDAVVLGGAVRMRRSGQRYAHGSTGQHPKPLAESTVLGGEQS